MGSSLADVLVTLPMLPMGLFLGSISEDKGQRLDFVPKE